MSCARCGGPVAAGQVCAQCGTPAPNAGGYSAPPPGGSWAPAAGAYSAPGAYPNTSTGPYGSPGQAPAAPEPTAYGYSTPHSSYDMFNTPQIPTPSGLGPFEAVKRVLSNYATFSGRASRSEYWWWTLMQFLAIFVPMVVVLVVAASTNTSPGEGALAGLLGLWVIVAVLGTIVPTIAATARRLHDIGQSGWLYLLIFIPSIGGIALLVLCALPSQPVANQYGLAPVGTKPPFQL